MASKRLMLSPPERRELSRRLRSRSVRSEDARRADVILRSARGQSVREIAGALECSTSYVQRWTNRFRQTRLSGLVAQHRGRKAGANAAPLDNGNQSDPRLPAGILDAFAFLSLIQPCRHAIVSATAITVCNAESSYPGKKTNLNGQQTVYSMLSCFMKHSLLILAIFAVIGSLRSEAQGIPVYRADKEVSEDPVLRKRAEELYSQGLSLPISVVKEQLSRGSCQLSLPQPHDRPMEGRDLWASARKSFVRVGYYYLCKGCKRWRLDLSCGFFLTEDGAVATALSRPGAGQGNEAKDA